MLALAVVLCHVYADFYTMLTWLYYCVVSVTKHIYLAVLCTVYANWNILLSAVQYCANVKVVDHEGRNALWYARTSGSVECTELLATAGCPDTATLPRRRGSLQPSKNDVFDKLPASVI